MKTPEDVEEFLGGGTEGGTKMFYGTRRITTIITLAPPFQPPKKTVFLMTINHATDRLKSAREDETLP